MNGAAGSNGDHGQLLLPELRLRILALLPPNELALNGRLACKDAAQRFSEPHHLTVRLGQPLPGHITADATSLAGASAAMRELTFCHKLHLFRTAAASGCEVNIDFAWQLVQPHVFPELLHTDHYRRIAEGRHESGGIVPHHTPAADIATPAVEAGHLHLVPSLAQRFPGLTDAGATLEAVARHHDLAALQRAWEVLGPEVCARAALETPVPAGEEDYPADCWKHTALGVWRRMMVAAASSPTYDAVAKMEWVWELGRVHGNDHFPVEHADVCGAAAGSGDLARLQWLRDRGFPWGTEKALEAVMQHAELGFIHRMEQDGGYLPPRDDEAWRHRWLLATAAGASCDSVAKLRWLVGCRGAGLTGMSFALRAAASSGNLEALQFLLLELRQTATPWLEAEGRELQGHLISEVVAAGNGDLATVRWLLQAGCSPTGAFRCVTDVLEGWPSDKPKDGEQLVEVLQLLVDAGVPLLGAEGQGASHPLSEATHRHHPWPVVRVLLDMLRSHGASNDDWKEVAWGAAGTGCEATLEALVGMGVCEKQPEAELYWYVSAARNGDRGTLACLQRLGLPLGEGVVAEAVRRWAPLPALKWLVEHGAPVSERAVRQMLHELAEEGKRFGKQRRPGVEAWLRGLLEGAAAEQ